MTDRLETREGLPEALRVLLEEYPREGWAADPGFHGLVSFWLDRHMMFRKLTGVLREESQNMLDAKTGPERFASAVSHYGGMFVNQLHGHHQIEDMHYFPILREKDSRIARGFDILDTDHHALDGHLNRFVEAANGAIGGMRGTDPKAAAGKFLSAVDGLGGLVSRHLADEEDLIVPVILKHGAAGLE